MNQLFIKKKNELNQKKKKGFTLVELVIVIAVIAILAAMAIPKFSSVRMNAKISNDVAAAKNIQSQIATLIASNNSAITVPTKLDTEVPKDVLENLDGNVSSGNAEALKGGKFKYTVDQNENIKVYVGDYQLYPEIESKKADDGKTYSTKGKEAYTQAVKDQPSKQEEDQPSKQEEGN